MWDSSMIIMLLEGTRDTLYMTLFATFFGYVFGLPMGIALMVTGRTAFAAVPGAAASVCIIYKILDVVVNITRSIPFLILLILVIPMTRQLSGRAMVRLQRLFRLRLRQHRLSHVWWSLH